MKEHERISLPSSIPSLRFDWTDHFWRGGELLVWGARAWVWDCGPVTGHWRPELSPDPVLELGPPPPQAVVLLLTLLPPLTHPVTPETTGQAWAISSLFKEKSRLSSLEKETRSKKWGEWNCFISADKKYCYVNQLYKRLDEKHFKLHNFKDILIFISNISSTQNWPGWRIHHILFFS